MSSIFHFIFDEDVTGYKMIIPSVSIGNVGQLAVDILIATVRPQKWAVAWHPALVPIVGGDPYDYSTNEIATACELYVSKENKLVFLQLRSPLAKEHGKDFLEKLADWTKERKFSEVLIAASLAAHERFGPQLTGQPFRYLTTSTQVDPAISKWGPALEKKQFDLIGGASEDYVMIGSGFAKLLFKYCSSRGIQTSVLMKFCDEGFNDTDANQLASFMNSWAKVVPPESKWRLPPSWSHLVGNGPPLGMF
ncbi:proteasome assembly chaperone 2 [Neocloeon triangulifer]|uniref:proteasome assembly chaperone 2 n=1 Tax=Neocloeon triangulifer TaxID=2078957 RepID=UPI00286F9F03|nr:proteasome assembly chaperone 2 [Neocloeon triangulifer]